ncbi:MAG TPA: Hok/gef cell toxic protein [Leclercia sp.]|nr:Hok/gef cell toxic protein [Leclercia sp.]
MTPLKYVAGIIVIICLTIVIFTFINRGKLCELTIKTKQHEVVAKLACAAG